MLILKDPPRIKDRFRNIVLTIGNFDGVHLGHQKILNKVRERAIEISGTSAVMTFEPHPVKVLKTSKEIKIITPFEEKTGLIEASGIDLLICLSFNKRLASTSAEEFIRDIIVENIGAVEVIIGSNYRFGREKKGTTELLQRCGKIYGFRTTALRCKTLSGKIISSSLIRDLIIHGKVYEASRLLGRPYTIQGEVIKGKGRGTSLLQIPTANIETTYDLIPSKGVYVVNVMINERVYGGVMNIGENPTFGGGPISLEVHILDFSGNLLGKNIRVHFLKRLRGERRFSHIEGLKKAILDDINSAREYLTLKSIIR